MVGVGLASPCAASEPVRPSKEPPRSFCVDDQQAMETGDLAADEWVEDASGFGIPDGTLQLVDVPRRQWRRPMELPLPPPSPAEAPILQEFSRPWRALCLPLPATSSEDVQGSLMRCYDPQYTPGEPTFASEVRTPPFLEPRVAVPESQTFLVIPRIRFTLGTIEPLVCRMLVYDVFQNCRVTEEFCFRIPGPMLDKTDCTLPPAALMHVLPTLKEKSLYLILKVSKVLVGDGDIATGPYCAPDKFASPTEQQKLVEKAVDCGMRLGRFQQPLAWGTMPLVKGTKQSMTLYRQRGCISEEQRLSLLSDAIRGTLKEKIVPALCELDIDDISAGEVSGVKFKTAGGAPLRLDIVDPFSEQSVQASEGDTSEQQNGGQNGDKIAQCREVQPLCPPSFVSNFGIAASGPVAVSYVNTLYLYPLQIEKCQYRNIAIRVQLLQREVDAVRGVEETEEAVLRSVYRANNQVGRSAYALVGYHQKNPQFEDEIKICLPVSLTTEHHIQFTFYHVHCKKLQPNQPQQELIGYAALPILRKDGTIMQDSKYTVNMTPAPVSSKPPATGGGISLSPGYVGAVRDGVIDNTKTVFTCRARVVSSVHSQDSAIAGFLSPFHGTRRSDTPKDAAANEDAIVKRLVGLTQSDASNLRYYFFLVTKFVLGYLRYGTSIVRWSAFRTLLTVIKKVTCNSQGKLEIHEMNRVLHFVHIVFDEKSIDDPSDSASPAKRERKSVFGALLETWLNVLNNKTSIEENTETLLLSRAYSNVLLQLILKSIAMTLLDQRDTPDGDVTSLPTMLAKNDEVMLERVLVQLMMYTHDDPSKDLKLKKDVNFSVAYFCRGIFLVVKNAFPARVIDRYVTWINVQGDAVSLCNIWFPFLNTLVDFELFPTVNGAVPVQQNNFTKRRAWLAEAVFEKLLLIVDKQEEHTIRVTAVRLLRRMFAAQAYNPRFQSRKGQERIALLYYPFLPGIVQFTAPGKLLAKRVGDAYSNSFGSTIGLPSSEIAALDLQKELVICVGHLLSSVSSLHLPLFFQLTHANSDQLSFTEALSFYHRVISPHSRRLETNNAVDNNNDGSHENSLTVNHDRGNCLYDEARVHANLALVQCMLEIFLVSGSSMTSDEPLWSRLLAPDASMSDTQTKLSLLEGIQRSHRQNFHRRAGGGLDSSAVASTKPNPIDSSSSPSDAAQNAVDGSSTHRSLPRNWSKQYASIQQRRSAPNVGVEEKAPTTNLSQDGAVRGKHEEEIAALQQAVATTAFRTIQTAMDQYEAVLRLIEVGRTPRFSADTTSSLQGVSTNQALALLGYLIELLFQLLQQASSIKGLAAELEQDGATEEDHQTDDLDDNATDSSTNSCFVVTLLQYLQAFVWRFSAALFATRIPGLPAVHDQRRIQLLISIAATATRVHVRHHAAMLLSQLLAVCYEQTGSFLLVKGPILKVLTLVFFPTSNAPDAALEISTASLRDLLDEMRTFATTSRDNVLSLPFSFHSLFIELLNDLTTKVHAYERWQGAYEAPDGAHDFEEIEEGIDRVVEDISPHWLLQEKLIWLNALLRLHERRDQFAEAACCKVAGIEYVQRAGLGNDSDSAHFGRLQQWVVRELFVARSYANRADWIEKELAICELLLVGLKQQRRFNEYQELIEDIGALVRRLADREESGGAQHNSSPFSFYRVRFAGGCVPTLIAKDEFIYKRSKFTSLGEFVGEMKTMLRAKYPQCERVDVVPEPKPLTGGGSNPNVIYLRVTTVEEALPEELSRLKAAQPRSHHWRIAFKFAVPFTLGSSSSYGKTSEQMKRITFLSVARVFPCRLNRQRVRLRHEEVRCPIDNSMDDIQKRCALLRAEIDKGRGGKTDLKTLTLVLKGSVDTHVHGGIPEVLDSFLAADPAQLQLVDAEGRAMSSHGSTRRRHELANLLVEFAELCWTCLRISRDAFRGAAPSVGGAQHTAPELIPVPSKPNAPLDSFLPPVNLPPASQSAAAPAAATRPPETDAASLLEEVSPLQTEFDRSFAALVDQLATKIPFVSSSAARLAELHQQTACLRSNVAPSRAASFPAAVPPLPSSVS
ncbi:hypothetical protein PR003_g10088 [Phytophthora rubi]|uniref:Dedicator of cytokinesis protein 7 n=1 Tax=Phytophthora rubi TaxID=129364 RepID=A0A6A3NPC2_9STRA|nr:hypothetical protein PR001_g9699 [Phytophthora rubi]KAE9042302.1 hypothetical protein PR002_g3979 [Phytophthora rubi]KAE9341241.1 hypothetical protein PR003_g10088 [Phytophthora rubi]